MPSIHLFNPYNDLALASPRQGRYTPPAGAMAITLGGAELPRWWADDGDAIIGHTHPGEDGAWAQYEPLPWGWSLDAKLRFIEAGVSADVLPSDAWLERHRELSHRRITIQVIKALGRERITPPIELTDVDELDAALNMVGGAAMIKLPYSTSGRGIIDTTALPPHELRRRVGGMIARQGSVMVERKLDKVVDFAMLFRMVGGEARFEGYSLFFSEREVSYAGNILMPDDMIRQRLGEYVAVDELWSLEEEMARALSAILGTDHQGWLGVDMMIFRDGSKYSVHPCVEVNLRMTMGVVAHYLTRRFYDGKPLRFLSVPGGGEMAGGMALVEPNQHFGFYIVGHS